jgi:putative RNA 2'-phosphotransferase
VVRTNDKQRFAYSADGNRIRANQGHSLPIDLGLVPVEPPELLYHGTVLRFLDAIRRDGLVKGKRHHVHLSPDPQTATNVGQRRGQPIVLAIEAGRMFRDGHAFYRSENGVWLTDAVPAAYVSE